MKRKPMALTTMKEDLLNEFREERIMINKQVELLDPLVATIHKPAAKHLINAGSLVLAEFSCYLACISCIAATVMLQTLYPFTVLNEILNNADYKKHLGATNLNYFTITIYAAGAVLSLFLLIVGRMARKIRQKNNILNDVCKDINIIVEQSLVRKAAIDTIEQRHLLNLSGINFVPNNNIYPEMQLHHRMAAVNEVFNPGYGG